MGHWELGMGKRTWGQGERLVSSSHLLSPCPPAPLLPAPSLLLQSYICSAECGKEFFVINLVYLDNRSFVATVLKVKRSLTKNWDGERWRN
ncbi:hypothetical protein FD724_22560 [Nostoc sp. C057]|nr:hypothetical protein FD724_22560 [Nostoc sp. C057]